MSDVGGPPGGGDFDPNRDIRATGHGEKQRDEKRKAEPLQDDDEGENNTPATRPSKRRKLATQSDTHSPNAVAGPSNEPAVLAWVVETTGINRLPAEIFEQIARYLPPDDVVRLSRSDPEIQKNLGNERVTALWETRVEHVTSLAGAQGFLRDLRSDLSNALPLMAGPMIALANRLIREAGSLNTAHGGMGQRAEVWNSLFVARTDLSVEQQGRLMIALANGIMSAWLGRPRQAAMQQRTEAWESIFDACTRDLPVEQQGPLLTALAYNIWSVGNGTLEDVRTQRAAAWYRLFDARTDLSVEQQRGLLTTLANRLSVAWGRIDSHQKDEAKAAIEAALARL